MQKILFIGVNWPEPTTAAGTRIMQLLQVFFKNNYLVTFASTASETEFSFNLKEYNISKVNIQLNNSSFDEFIDVLQPNIVIFDRFVIEEQFGWRVAEQVPNALRILDTEDLHSLRTVRGELHKKGMPFTKESWLQSDVAKREIASIYRCDLSLIISSFELELLKNSLPINESQLFYLPFMVNKVLPVEIAEYPEFEARKDFICIGNGKHAPNVDAVIHLKNTIWPLIRAQLPESNLHIYGSYLPQQILQMNKPSEGFFVKGFTEDLKLTFSKARINLAPLRFGAGLKGKLIDAMQFGTPSITTTVGAEGMQADLPWNGAITDNPVEFANKAVVLYSDKKEWLLAQQNGFSILNQFFNAEELAVKLILRIEELGTTLDNHRSSNFIGTLLMHQTMQSTKYMSRWIEAKNSVKS